MGYALLIFIFLVILGLITAFIIQGLNKGASGFKLMVLGINITLFGGIIAMKPDSYLGVLVATLGVLISFIGFGKQ